MTLEQNKMRWVKLINNLSFEIRRGTLIKFSSKKLLEKDVIMMVCEGVRDPFRLGLIPITGTQAGINMYTLFPKEATENGLEVEVLFKNWNQWIESDSDVNEVLIHEGLSAYEL